MTGNNEFHLSNDNYVARMLKANEEVQTWVDSETGEFIRETSNHMRFVMEQPEVAGENLRTFVRENPEMLMRFSAGCFSLLKVMAQKRSRSRHPAGKKGKKANLTVVDNDGGTQSATVSYVEALVDGWVPERPQGEVFEDLGFCIDLQRSALKAREGKNPFSATDDAVLATYIADLDHNLECGYGLNCQMLAKVMEGSAIESVSYFGRLLGTVFTPPKEERETFYEAFNEMDQMVTDRYEAMASLAYADKVGEPVMMMMESLIDLPTVTWHGNEATWRVNVARHDEIVEALREQVATDLKEVRKAVDDYPAEGDKAAVGYLMDVEGSLRGDKVDLRKAVSLIDEMGKGVSAYARQSAQRLLSIVAQFDR